ncbi:DUF898 domain-containing protein [Thalassospira sp. HF15]|uniref:YjgN family protein n=1 Tax=Thalassospira sp. HF15 TaxID=2722755 RepID=UPI0014313DB8|nr:DUF898 family protein [Thalassospira sp. HF15]NIY75904.1 DUF898 domain-containing protein [Thalassospira sp. HF15]
MTTHPNGPKDSDSQDINGTQPTKSADDTGSAETSDGPNDDHTTNNEAAEPTEPNHGPDETETVKTDDPSGIGYLGDWNAVLKLSCWNTLWTILTLGIFRFWAKTRMRRYIWSNIIIDGDALEYTGRGLELFLGFLIVALVAAPVLFGLGFASTMLPPEFAMVPDMMLYLAAAFLFYYASYRATRYRYSRTYWRGIRGQLGGSAFRYALIGFGSSILTGFSLGLLAPYAFIATTRYQTDNTWIGDSQAQFDGKFGAVFKKWLKNWALIVLIAAIAIGVSVYGSSNGITWLPFAMGIPAYLFAIGLFVNYRVWLFRYQAGVTSLADITFESRLSTSQYIVILLKFLGISLVLMVILGLLFWTFGGAYFHMTSSPAYTMGETEKMLMVFVPTLIALLIIAPMFSITAFVFVIHAMLSADINSLDYSGEITDLHANPSQQAAPRTGEGLADALDIGSF